MHRIGIISLALTMLTACANTPALNTSAEKPALETTVEEINSGCSWRQSYERCKEFAKTTVSIDGVFLYGSADQYAPHLFPIGTNTKTHDFWDRNDTPKAVDFKIVEWGKSRRKRLIKFNHKPVRINAVANTECVMAYRWLDEEVSSTDEFVMIGGYCHTQADTYLTDFKVEPIVQVEEICHPQMHCTDENGVDHPPHRMWVLEKNIKHYPAPMYQQVIPKESTPS